MRIRVGALLVLLVGCSSGSQHAAAPPAKAPGPAAPAPLAAPDPAPGAPAASAAPSDDHPGHAYCIGGADDTTSVCGQDASVHKNWHLHGFLRGHDGQCYECWDEQNNDCEAGVPRTQPFQYAGAAKGSCSSSDMAPPVLANARRGTAAP